MLRSRNSLALTLSFAAIAISPVATAAIITIQEDAKLLGTGVMAYDGFGGAIMTQGDLAVVGAPFQATATGAAYVFERSSSGWSQTAKLISSEAQVATYFGVAVALDGDILAVGAYGRDNPTDFSPDEGAVYVFERIGGVWQETQLLTAPDAHFDDHFGHTVALDGDVLAIGAPWNNQRRGAVYVFERVAGSFRYKAKLVSPDGAVEDRLGSALGVSGDTIMAGAPHDDDDGVASGVAFAFQKVSGTWLFNAKVKPPGLGAIHQFSVDLAIQGDLALFGAPGDDDGGTDAGAAYLYHRVGSTWTLVNKFIPAAVQPNAQVGRAVDVRDDLIVLGSVASDSGAMSGAVHLYRPHGSVWTEEYRAIASDGVAGDYLGSRVAIGDDLVLASATGDDDQGENSGSVYVVGQRFYEHGLGCPGSGGITPTLNAWGAATVGGTVNIDVHEALGGSSAFFFLGASPASLFMGAGCTLNVQPPVGPFGPLPLSGVGAGAGVLQIPFVVPTGFPSVTVHMQAFVVDAGAIHPAGFSSTNGFAVRMD